MKPVKVLEAEKRDAGLSKTISSDNKGFAMLQKMGFKPGMTLGKKGKLRTVTKQRGVLLRICCFISQLFWPFVFITRFQN